MEMVIANENKEIDVRLRRFEEQSLEILQRILNAPYKESFKSPHLANVLEDIVEVWGGSSGYARHLYALYLAAKPGSPTRLRCMELIERILKESSAQGYVERPLSTLSDEEVEKVYLEHRSRLMKDLRIVDGTTVDSRDLAAG